MRLLQDAWRDFGPDGFEVLVLEEVSDNSGSTDYHVRPDNLSLAKQHYIDERSDLNTDKAIVRKEFAGLFETAAWRSAPNPAGRASQPIVQARPDRTHRRPTPTPTPSPDPDRSVVPHAPGIYAIVNVSNGERYVVLRHERLGGIVSHYYSTAA